MTTNSSSPFPVIKLGPADVIPVFKNPKDKAFLNNAGEIATFPTKAATIYPNTFRSHGKISDSSLTPSSRDYLSPSQYEMLYMIEHIPTGYFYLVDSANPLYSYPVYDFVQTVSGQKEIVLSHESQWGITPTNAKGSRFGGEPTGFNMSSWPHSNGKPLLFAAQYELDNGKYAHVFTISENELYLASSPADCILVQDGPVPGHIRLLPAKTTPESLLRHPHWAFAPVPRASQHPVAPWWVRGDETPENGSYRFLGQFGTSSVESVNKISGNKELDVWDFAFGDLGDMYVFINDETLEGIALWQGF